MKEMSKIKIYQSKSISFVKQEKEFLENLRHPFMVNMYYSFQDNENLYFILDYLQGGDLRYHINRNKEFLTKNLNIFTEETIKFIISNIILILEYLYNNRIIHRDLKPENLVFDKKGYLYLTDFGIACKYNSSNNNIIHSGGTPIYVAPETLLKKSNNFTVDYFSLGIIIYELIFNKTPYNGKNAKDILEEVLYKEIIIKYSDIPNNHFFNSNICDFVNRLLKRKSEERLGYNGIYEIKNHPWLNKVKWDKILKKEIKSPFIITENENYDFKNANKEEIIDYENDDIININENRFFKNFYFNYYEKYNTIKNKIEQSEKDDNISNIDDMSTINTRRKNKM
jgi:serine/threonine protein kinase